MHNQVDFNLQKFVILGDCGVGKSNILRRFLQDRFSQQHQPTIGVQYFTKVYQFEENKMKICFWDTAGEQKYKSLSKIYFKSAAAIILVFDITSIQSYQNIDVWYQLIKNTIDINQTKMIILGNKIDLEQERVISTLTAKQRFMQKFQLPYFESSAKLDKGIKQSLMFLIKQIFTNLQNNLVTGTKFNSKTEKSMNSSKLESVLSIQAKKKQSYKCCDS